LLSKFLIPLFFCITCFLSNHVWKFRKYKRKSCSKQQYTHERCNKCWREKIVFKNLMKCEKLGTKIFITCWICLKKIEWKIILLGERKKEKKLKCVWNDSKLCSLMLTYKGEIIIPKFTMKEAQSNFSFFFNVLCFIKSLIFFYLK
jgi:hypothetical protein